MEYRVTANVGAPPAAVWRLFTDLERWPELSPSTSEVRRLDDGPLQVGSEAMVKQPGLPRARWRVTGMAPDRIFPWQTSAGGVTTVGDHRVEPTATGSTITLTLYIRGPLAGLAALLFGRRAKRSVSMELEGFRAAADAAP